MDSTCIRRIYSSEISFTAYNRKNNHQIMKRTDAAQNILQFCDKNLKHIKIIQLKQFSSNKLYMYTYY